MEIYICDNGPLRAVVYVTVDGERIAFPETSYPKLVNLMRVLGARASESPGPSASHWILDIDPVRERALAADHANAQMSIELEEARFAFQQMSEKLQGEVDRLLDELETSTARAVSDAAFAKDRISTLEKLLAGAVNEQQAIQTAHWWDRIRWAFRFKGEE